MKPFKFKFLIFSSLFFLTNLSSLRGDISEYEKDLYLTPAGKYSEKDIIENGYMTRSQKYSHFIPSHNHSPKVGDMICPITLTKANPECSWVIDGKSYQFCCPPCIDEFLLLAKEHPEDVQNPENYIKQ